MEIDKVASIDLTELAAGYDAKRQMDPAEFERLLECIFHYGKVAGRVLEIGCGTGKLPSTYGCPDGQRSARLPNFFLPPAISQFIRIRYHRIPPQLVPNYAQLYGLSRLCDSAGDGSIIVPARV